MTDGRHINDNTIKHGKSCVMKQVKGMGNLRNNAHAFADV